MPSEILKYGGRDNRYKLCQCFRCKRVERCTPEFDFFTKTGDDSGPLYCLACLHLEMGVTPDETIVRRYPDA